MLMLQSFVLLLLLLLAREQFLLHYSSCYVLTNHCRGVVYQYTGDP